jgi:dimethylhistidine N-methyltransferase
MSYAGQDTKGISIKETSDAREVAGDIITGLSATPPRLPSKYFYDETGSVLFDQICTLPEYYPTRTETGILRDNISSVCDAIGTGSLLIEPGCGSCDKTRILLEHHDDLAGFVPIDISGDYLKSIAGDIQEQHPGLSVQPLALDFMQPFELPDSGGHASEARRVVFYPGSTLGNFVPSQARKFLAQMASLIGKDGRLILGLDQKKDPAILEKAYDDAQGVTADFNLNMLHHLNRRLGQSVFDVSAFRHRARWNEDENRIEMHLVSRYAHEFVLQEKRYTFEKDDYIITEFSHKYTDDSLRKLLAGLFEITQVWKDDDGLFGLYCIEPV